MRQGGEDRSGPAVLRGSVIRLRRKCGKPNCRCQEGDLHETWALSCSEGGRTRLVTLRPSEVAGVRQAVARYRRALADLERQAMRGLGQLRQGRGRTRKEGRP